MATLISCDGRIGTNGHCNKCGRKSEITSNRCINLIEMVQEVIMTEEEKFKMYMKLSKKELASMLAHRDMYPPMVPIVYQPEFDPDIICPYTTDGIWPTLQGNNFSFVWAQECEIIVAEG